MRKVIRPNKSDLEEFRKIHSVKETAKFFKLSLCTMENILREYGIYGVNYLKRTNAPSELTQEQKEILIGNLLGDGWINCLKSDSSNTSFGLEQKLDNLDYVKYLYKIYGIFSSKYREGQTKKPQRINGKICHIATGEYTYWCKIETIAHPVFRDLRFKWYKNAFCQSPKIISKDLDLTWRTIASWACDDGCNQPLAKRFIFYTNGFTIEDVEFLLNIFNKKFNINGKIYLHKKTQPILSFSKDHAEEVRSQIKPFIPWDCFSYKLKGN